MICMKTPTQFDDDVFFFQLIIHKLVAANAIKYIDELNIRGLETLTGEKLCNVC